MRTGKVEQAQEAQQLLGGLLAGAQDEGGGLCQAVHLQHVRLVVVEAVALRQVQAEQEPPLQRNARVSGFRGRVQNSGCVIIGNVSAVSHGSLARRALHVHSQHLLGLLRR